MYDGNSRVRFSFGCFRNIPARLILYILCLTCIMITFLLRAIINLTILAMVKEHDPDNSTETANATETFCLLTNDDKTALRNDYGGTIEWSLDEQHYVLTSFFWTYIISQAFGGIIVQKFSSKIVILLSVLISSACILCIPLASFNYILVVILEMINGLSQGVTWPALYAIIAWWIPITERSRFVTCFHGLSIGITLAQFTSGFIISSIGWQYVFYISGVMGLLWCLGWYLLMYDKPELHPRISKKEISYIKANREKVLKTQKRQIPWKSMFLSLPVWAIIITSFGRLWFTSVVIIYGPMYLKSIIGLDVRMNGLLSGSISIACFITAAITSYVADKLQTHQVISIGLNRKAITGIGQIIVSTGLVAIGYLGCNRALNITIWTLVQLASSINFIGVIVSIVDIAPNFSGPVTGLVQTFSMSTHVLAPLVVKGFLQSGSNLGAWKRIFNTSAGIGYASYIFYLMFLSTDVQEWDKEDQVDELERITNKCLLS